MNPSTTALTLNMQLPNIATVSWAVQGDQLARIITATLVDGSTPWTPEASYHGVVRFHKPDGTSGIYDVDEDGDPAVTWSGNIATITIAQQALTCAGSVTMQLEFYDTNNARITAFGWTNNVQPSAVTDTEFLSTDYYNILTLQIAAVLEVADEMTPYSNTPEMDGTGAPGTSLLYSRGDHVHPTDTSRASAAVLNTYTKPNLLDNWFFGAGVINQRGQTYYDTAGYTLDRWRLTAAGRLSITTESTGGWRVGSSLGTTTVKQILLNAINEPVTISVFVPWINGAATVLLQKSDDSYYPGLTINSTGVYSQTVTGGNVKAVAISTSQNNFVDILAVKLEVGTTQTLAHQTNNTWALNELPNTSLELFKCQRYYWKAGQYQRIQVAYIGQNSLQFFIPTTETMVSSPTISSDFVVETIDGTSQTGFTFSTLYTAPNGIGISAAKTNHGLTNATLRLNAAVFSSDL